MLLRFFLSLLMFNLIFCENIDLKKVENLEIQDKILAIIYHTEGSYIILQSDMKPNLDGRPRNLKDLVLERLMLLDATNLKITVTDADVDRYLAQIQKQNNLTKADLSKAFRETGFTFEQGIEQLRNSLVINSILDYRVKNKAVVDKKEIEKYYNDNPIYQDAEYVIAQATIPFEGSPDKKKIKIDNAIKSGEIINIVAWDDPIKLKDDEFAPEKAYIKDLDAGSIVKLEETRDSLTLLRLISKTTKVLVPLEERERDITNILGKEKFDKALKEYHTSLLNPEDKVLGKFQIKYLE